VQVGLAAHELDEDIVPPRSSPTTWSGWWRSATRWTTQRRASSRTARSFDESWSKRSDCSMAETTQPRAQSRTALFGSRLGECSRSARGRGAGDSGARHRPSWRSRRR
jgi:hypothetical protein